MKMLYYKTKDELLRLIKEHDLFEENIMLKCVSDFIPYGINTVHKTDFTQPQ